MSKAHKVYESTAYSLSGVKKGRTWRDVAQRLGYDAHYIATLSAVCAGKPGAISREGENVLRVRLGLRPVWPAEVEPCPSCGEAHGKGLDCHGKPIADVVVLTEGERVVRRAKRPRTYPKCHRPRMTDEEYTEYLQWRAQRKDQP